jgi:hypothetical protein
MGMQFNFVVSTNEGLSGFGRKSDLKLCAAYRKRFFNPGWDLSMHWECT